MSLIGWKKFLWDDASSGLAYHWLLSRVAVSQVYPASFCLGHVIPSPNSVF